VNVYPFIEAERVAGAGHVRRACVLLKVSRAAYYAWSAQGPCRHTLADEELLMRILAAHKASRGAYGSPRITRALRAAGLRVGRKRIARLMALRGRGGRARRRTRRTTIADPAASGRARDLLQRNFAPQAHEIDTLWCGDICLRAHLGGLGLPGHGDRPLQPARGRSRAGRLPARLAGGRGARHGGHATASGAGADLPQR